MRMRVIAAVILCMCYTLVREWRFIGVFIIIIVRLSLFLSVS